jgi:hypothetical protein
MDHQRSDPIRQAVACGEFHRAALLWNEYVTEIREEIGQGTCTEARMAETAELVEWSRRVVLCDRAHAQGQLATIWVASQYDPDDLPRPSCFRASL